MQTSPRYGTPINILCVHTNEGPEGDNAAAGLAAYLQTIDGGYHAIFDNAHTVITAPDNIVVWGAGGINAHSLHGCCIGYAAQSPQEWMDAFSRGELDQAAAWFADKCKTYGIPVRRLSPAQVKNLDRGICGHGDVSAAGFTESMGHTDPGPNFPWTPFLAKVSAIVNPAPIISPAEKARLVAIDAWRHRVHAKALKYGDQNHDVAILINALRRKKFLKWWVRGNKYGPALRTGVVKFKNTIPELATQPAPLKGEVFGGDAADALVGLG